MGQRSQFYTQFWENEDKQNLSAMHLQWSWGHYSIIRAKQLLEFISKEIRDNTADNGLFNYSMLLGGACKEAKETREMIYALTQLNLNIGSYVKGIDLVKEELETKFYDLMHEDGKEDYREIMQEFNRQLNTKFGNDDEKPMIELDKRYKINPFEQDNNDGILVIQVNKDGKIKFCFDLLQSQDFIPLTAKEYMKEYTEDKKSLSKEEQQELQEMIDYVDSFELLTTEELHKIFLTTYEY